MSDSEVKPTAYFVGTPNSGKTTLYNWVTGSKFRSVNYPGATVDYSKGTSLEIYGETFNAVDTPGIYSMTPKTPEEEVTEKVLFEMLPKAGSSVLVVTVDATHFSRQMILAEQLKSAGFSVVIALTMSDVMARKSVNFDIYKLRQIVGCPVVPVDGRLGGNIHNLVGEIRENFAANTDPHRRQWTMEDYQKLFSKYDKIREDITRTGQSKRLPRDDWHQTFDQKWDRFFLHPILGILIFTLAMVGAFTAVFWLAAPLMDLVDGAFTYLSHSIGQRVSHTLLADFLSNGLIAGVGAFAVFVPQIAILFLILTILEDTGYMARAATLIDKPLQKIGLNGRSFVPLMSGFACAVPAMMAARTIPNKKERFLTQFIIPLMTCSARLPVYALILAFVFVGEPAWKPGVGLALLYLLAILTGAAASTVLNRFLPKSKDSFFALELPSYRVPVARKVVKSVYERTAAFVKRAGPIIFVLSIVVWAATTFPNFDLKDDQQKITTSYAGQMGQWIEPVFEPMGADWRVGLGIISSFAAREVFVSTLAVVFNAGADEDEETMQASLIEKMNNAHFLNQPDKKIFTVASTCSLLVFFMIALQCMATVGIARREFGNWKITLLQLFAFNILGYIGAVITYQVLS